MTASDTLLPVASFVQCPACGGDSAIETDDSIVCRECGETWPQAVSGLKHRTGGPPAPRPKGGELIVAERRPLVTYADTADTAWAAKIAADHGAPPQRRSRLPMTAAAMASIFFLAAFFAGREAAVAALPDLAGLYAAIGLPVNLQGLAIEDVGAERTPTFAGTRLTVRATIRNLSNAPLSIPPLATILYDDVRAPAGAYSFDSPKTTLGAGASLPILLDLDGAPEKAAEVALRFRRPGESLPAAGDVQVTE